MPVMTSMAQNYKNSVDWILGAYSDAGVSFPNGFQKDAIQNAVGARNTNKWKGWKCDISYFENSHGRFVIVEDHGTTGLTGDNISQKDIKQMMAERKYLPAKERLARFSSMFNSGGNTTGSGLYGAGKSVYAVASEEYTYYFDSLRDDCKYIANVNNCGQIMETALEGDAAKEFILEKTGLSDKKSVGTRIIIVSPKQELVEAIKDGSLVSFIQESWWRIIERLTDDSAITVNGRPVSTPSSIKKAPHTYELPSPDFVSPGHRVKHFGLYVFKDDSSWHGISYYRKGMKIGEIDIKDVPKPVEGKYWGFIEVDELWEEELAEIEDKVHFGVSKGKKITTQYQILKNYCNNKFKSCMVDWGYIKDKESEDKKLKDELKGIAEELQDLFEKLKFEDLGKGPQKPTFDVRWQNIHYPEAETVRVTAGDTISFSVRIKSSYATDKRCDYKLSIIDPETGTVISQIDSGRIPVKPNSTYQKAYNHIITKENSRQYAENRIALSVKVLGSGKEITKFLPYFFDIDKPNNPREIVDLTLHECLFPVPGSRRVNFDEAVRNVCWKIENKRNHTLNYQLNVSIHNASDKTCPKIKDVTSFSGSILPFEDVLTPHVDEIVFDRKTYEPYLSEGVLELRARLIASDDDPMFEKGDKITFYNFRIFLNMDEKNGKSDSFDIQLANAPDRFERAWRTAFNGRTITLNVGHAAYLNLSDYPEIQHAYLREHMMKQFVLLYLDEGKFDVFGDGFAELDPQEAADKVIQKIESVYYLSLKS